MFYFDECRDLQTMTRYFLTKHGHDTRTFSSKLQALTHSRPAPTKLRQHRREPQRRRLCAEPRPGRGREEPHAARRFRARGSRREDRLLLQPFFPTALLFCCFSFRCVSGPVLSPAESVFYVFLSDFR